MSLIDPVYCINCRKPLDKSDAFCRHCGADQRRPAAPSQPEQTVSLPIPSLPPTVTVPPDAVPVYYKTCPVCGQPAVLSMPACGRCGAPYPPLSAPGTAQPPIMPGAGAPLPSQPTSGSRGPALAIIAVLLALLLGAALFSLHRSSQAPAPQGEDAAGSLMQSSGPFHERPSPIETPTISITSTVEDETTCVFQDRAGHVYDLRVDQ